MDPRWHIPGRWRLPFVAWALVIVAITWPIVAGRELDFTLVAARSAELSNAGFDRPPRLAAAWIVIVALAQMIVILWLDLLWARFSGRDLAKAEKMRARAARRERGARRTRRVVSADRRHPLAEHRRLVRSRSRRRAHARRQHVRHERRHLGAARRRAHWRLGWRPWIGAVAYAVLAAGMWTAGSRTALLAFAVGSAGLLVAHRAAARLLAAAHGADRPADRRRARWCSRWPSRRAAATARARCSVCSIACRGSRPARCRDSPTRCGPASATARPPPRSPPSTRGPASASAAFTSSPPTTSTARSAGGSRRTTRRTGGGIRSRSWACSARCPSLWISVMIVVALLWRGVSDVEPIGVTTVIRAALIGVGLASLLGVPTQLPASSLAFVTLLFWLTALPPAAEARRAPARAQGHRVAFALAFVVAVGVAHQRARRSPRVVARASDRGAVQLRPLGAGRRVRVRRAALVGETVRRRGFRSEPLSPRDHVGAEPGRRHPARDRHASHSTAAASSIEP